MNNNNFPRINYEEDMYNYNHNVNKKDKINNPNINNNNATTNKTIKNKNINNSTYVKVLYEEYNF